MQTADNFRTFSESIFYTQILDENITFIRYSKDCLRRLDIAVRLPVQTYAQIVSPKSLHKMFSFYLFTQTSTL